MFTGLIQRIGRCENLARRSEGFTISVKHDPWDKPLEKGESVSVQGVCLTVTRFSDNLFECDVLEETALKTTISSLKKGETLNLERAVPSDGRFGGHFVTGHIDGLGKVARITMRGDDREIEIVCSDEIMECVALKGSVACDGVSLTVSGVRDNSFAVNIIPFTWSNTSLQCLGEDKSVNIETDILAKYVRKHTESSSKKNITMEDLESSFG